MEEKVIEVSKMDDVGYRIDGVGKIDDIFNAIHGQIRYLAYTQDKEFEEMITLLENSEAELREEEGKPFKQKVAEVFKSDEDEMYYSTLIGDYDDQIRALHMLAKNIAANSGVALEDVLSEVEDTENDFRDNNDEQIAKRRS